MRATPRATRDDDGSFYAYDATLWKATKDVFGDVPTQPYLRVVQTGIVVVLSMITDAGFSGDWSRIGAITTTQEGYARSFIAFVCAAHGALGVVAYDVAKQRGLNPYWAFAKTFVIGFTAFCETAFGEEAGREGDDDDAASS